MTEERQFAVDGRIEALAHLMSFILAGTLKDRSARDRAEIVDLLRYPFVPKPEHETAALDYPGRMRREHLLQTLEDVVQQALRFAGPA